MKRDDLRRKAEKKLGQRTEAEFNKLTAGEVRRLAHELQVHQAELEMQNEELRRTQAELEESRAKYADLYDFSPAGYFTFDKDGLILEVNLSGAALLDVGRKYLMKKPFSLFIHKDDQDVFYSHRQDIFRTKTRQTCELRIMKKKGQQFHAYLESILLEDAEGKKLCRTSLIDITERRLLEEELKKAKSALAIKVSERTSELEATVKILNSDITERKDVEERLRTREEQYSRIVNTSMEGVWQLDSQGNTTFVNKQMAELLGYSEEEMFGRQLFDFMDEAARRDAEQLLERRRKGISERHDFRFKKKDGSDIWTIVATNPILNDKGEFTGAIGMITDITERKKVEDDLYKAKKEIEKWNIELEKRVKEKSEELANAYSRLIQAEKLSVMGQMAAGLAHELNSPLAGLLPMLESFSERAEKGSADQKELALMLKAANHMARVINDFSVFSRDTKGEFTGLSLNEIIEDTLSFSAVRLRRKGISLKKEYEEMLPLVMGDRTQLQQVVLNLITNACDALPERGSLCVRTGCSGDRKNVTMQFIDNGPGIKKENLSRIFDLFFTTKKPGEGTGLGLPVSRGIIEKHGGKISVESGPGKGTIFTVVLPAVGMRNGLKSG